MEMSKGIKCEREEYCRGCMLVPDMVNGDEKLMVGDSKELKGDEVRMSTGTISTYLP